MTNPQIPVGDTSYRAARVAEGVGYGASAAIASQRASTVTPAAANGDTLVTNTLHSHMTCQRPIAFVHAACSGVGDTFDVNFCKTVGTTVDGMQRVVGGDQMAAQGFA